MIFREAPDKRDLELFHRILEIPQEFRCQQSTTGTWNLPKNHILLGVRQSEFFGWTKLSKVEQAPIGFKFYLGASHFDVFESYVNSSFPSKAHELFVGNSTYDYSPPNISFGEIHDYSPITEILTKGWYPKLKHLSLGTTELFCNAEGINGSVGNITELLKRMPNLEKLELGGYFAIDEPISLPKLKEIDINVVSCCETPVSKEPTEETFKNLCKSDLPLLEDFCVNLSCDGDFKRQTNYYFPEKFLEGKSTPNLKKIEISGLFRKGESQRLAKSKVGKDCIRLFSNISEAYFLAVDVHYEADTAYVCGVTFSDHMQSDPDKVYYSKLSTPGEYQSGEFYKRELPCIVKLIEEHMLLPAVIVIDGFTYLDSSNRWGLGAHLSDTFFQEGKEVAVIGVAKNRRENTPKEWQVYRGDSSKPLYVKAVGLDDEFSKDIISNMSGAYRIPSLLKLVDRLCRDKAVK